MSEQTELFVEECPDCEGTGLIYFDPGKPYEYRMWCKRCCEHKKVYQALDGERCDQCSELVDADTRP